MVVLGNCTPLLWLSDPSLFLVHGGGGLAMLQEQLAFDWLCDQWEGHAAHIDLHCQGQFLSPVQDLLGFLTKKFCATDA